MRLLGRISILLILFLSFYPALCSADSQGQQVDFLLNGAIDASGYPLSEGSITSYYPGTTTPKSLYSDYLLTTPLSNPASLDTFGKLQAWGDGTYKFVLKNSAGAVSATIDGVEYRSINALLADPTDPFGTTLYRTNLVASYINADAMYIASATFPFTPTNDYDPVNKEYVDDQVATFTAAAATFSVDIASITIDIATLTASMSYALPLIAANTETIASATASFTAYLPIDGSVAMTEFIKLTPVATPSSPVEGMIYFDSTSKKLTVYDGSTWQACW